MKPFSSYCNIAKNGRGPATPLWVLHHARQTFYKWFRLIPTQYKKLCKNIQLFSSKKLLKMSQKSRCAPAVLQKLPDFGNHKSKVKFCRSKVKFFAIIQANVGFRQNVGLWLQRNLPYCKYLGSYLNPDNNLNYSKYKDQLDDR